MRDPEPTQAVTDRIVFIGDSFTMGYGVQDNEAFPALVRATLRRQGITIPVLNTGMGNNGNGRWVKLFDHDMERYRPNIVVFQVMANDFDDNLVEHLFLYDGTGALHELPVGPPSFARKMQTFVESIPGLSYSHLVGLVWAAMNASDNEPLPQSANYGSAARDNTNLTSDALTTALVRASVD